MLRLLLAARAKVDVRGAHGFTALAMAVFANNPPAVELLLRAGADPKQTMPGVSE